ncbi:hypothetical protein DV735_g1090, partial [Chaetothyriales sp. CBS 134920]
MAADGETVLIVGGGLAGLVAAHELTQKKIHVTILDQEPEASLGGQAFWSLGGIFCVNSTDQRSKGIKDSRELALSDWLNSAAFDREKEDYWPKQWAKAFVDFATDDMERYLKNLGVTFLTVGWAERGGGVADGHGNSVPRFHLTWGTGPQVLRAFAEPVRAAEKNGLVQFRFRHKVDDLVLDDKSGTVVGVRGQVLEAADTPRGVATSRKAVGEFEIRGKAVVIATGGIGGNVDAVKGNWPVDRLGPTVPNHFVVGVPAHVDGRALDIAKKVGASVINMDRMWHYTEGLANWDPIWPGHGIRLIPGPSSLWLDATGKRFPPFVYPGCDTLATLRHICATGYDYSWFVLNRKIVAREFGLSGSEQNSDITNKSMLQLLRRAFGSYGTLEVQNFMKHGEDFVVETDLRSLVEGMNRLARERGGPALDYDFIHKEIKTRDDQLQNPFTKDAQIMLINNARQYAAEKTRVAAPHAILDPSAGPLVAVRLNLLTRKSLGGLETNLDGNVLRTDGAPFSGLYAAGEATGFGGGGVHGYSALEGTFLGGCIFSGRAVGRTLVKQLAKTVDAKV